jgi:hypothetical protein
VVCNDSAVGVRERVQRAIESPVAEAERVLAEAPHAKPHERLSILMNGWFRGIAGALDELAIELESLRTAGPPPAPEPAQRTQRQSDDEQPPENEPAGPEERAEPQATEAELAERARASRAETEAVRAERDSEAEGEDASGEPGPTASTPQAEEP